MAEPVDARTIRVQYGSEGYQVVLDDGTPIANVLSVALDIWPRLHAIITVRVVVEDIEMKNEG